MPIETATHIHELNELNPASTDLVNEGDNHIRLMKSAIKATFPNVTGPITLSHTDINGLSAAANAYTDQEITGEVQARDTAIAQAETRVNNRITTLDNRVSSDAYQATLLAQRVSANETALAAKGVAGTYGNSTQSPVLTINDKGLVTAASTAAIANPSFGVINRSDSFGNDNTFSVPANAVSISGTARIYMGSNRGARLSCQIKNGSTVLDTFDLCGSNETNGNDGGSGMYVRHCWHVSLPSNATHIRLYRSSGSNGISGVINQIQTFG